MRNIPAKLASVLSSKNIALAPKVLLYRRYWDTQEQKFKLENTGLDITEYLVNQGKVNLQLDTNEVDTWTISNVSLIFKNELALFNRPDGLFNGFFSYGSKITFLIKARGVESEGVCVFTGYIYTAPVYRSNGNSIEITLTSDFEFLNNLTAESFCQTKIDEEATEISGSSNKDFRTVETAVGFIDTVKYGATFATAINLFAGKDFSVSDLNEYSLGAKISLDIIPSAGFKMWVSYRHWYKDMRIEEAVNALLDIAEIHDRLVEKPIFSKIGAKVYETNIYDSTTRWFTQVQSEGDNESVLVANYDFLYVYDWNRFLIASQGPPSTKLMPLKANSFKGLFLNRHGEIVLTSVGSYLWAVVDDNGNGIYIEFWYQQNPVLLKSRIGRLANFTNKFLLFEIDNIVGFEINNNNSLYAYTGTSTTYLGRTYLGKQVFSSPPANIFMSVPSYGWANNEFYYSREIPNISGQTIDSLISNWFDNSNLERYGNKPVMRFDFHQSSEDFVRWGAFSASLRNPPGVTGGITNFYWCDSDDGEVYSTPLVILPEVSIPSTKRYLRIYVRIESSYANSKIVDNMTVWSYASGTSLPVVNLTGLNISDALKQFAKLVAFELGVSQDGILFFRSREGKENSYILDNTKIESIESIQDDIENLFNAIVTKYGNYEFRVDDNTYGKARPNTIDIYGLRIKEISYDNLIPPNNVDISEAISTINYEAHCDVQPLIKIRMKMDLALELGDIIKISCDNDFLANPTNHSQKLTRLLTYNLPVRVLSIAFDFDKRLIDLTVKGVNTDFARAWQQAGDLRQPDDNNYRVYT